MGGWVRVKGSQAGQPTMFLSILLLISSTQALRFASFFQAGGICTIVYTSSYIDELGMAMRVREYAPTRECRMYAQILHKCAN